MKTSFLVGETVVDYTILSKKHDANENWVGSELSLRIPRIGDFALRVVTKDYFVSEEILHALDHEETIATLLDELPEDVIDRTPPFVLNDSEISQEVLDKKFTNRVVEEDLARSLWQDTTVE